MNKKTTQKIKKRSVLELTHLEARKFFLKSQSYFNLDLPSYITFEKVLENVDSALTQKKLSAHCEKPRDYDDLNYKILTNRDGKYAWRPMQLINPALYVSLVHTITEENNWAYIKDRFNFFNKPKILIGSIPTESYIYKKDAKQQILLWWEKIEQQSIELALSFDYLIHTDIADCYGSIYTHSIAWALHDKKEIKSKPKDLSLIGNNIDKQIQDMSYGQSNSIPQGSVLMDFIAEMVLGYIDTELSKKILGSRIKDYKILRYRDDYRIFVNNPREGEEILKHLSAIINDMGMKLNSSKTRVSNQVIKNSIKADKLFWERQNKERDNLQKYLLIIHELSQEYPNSGSLIRALNDFNKVLGKQKKVWAVLPLISIITDIAYHNPRAYSAASAILSSLITILPPVKN